MSQSRIEDSLQALGGSTVYTFDSPQASVLERFASPLSQQGLFRGYSSTIEITCPEFTSLCPKTGQPDFATILIHYQPLKWCVESKSLKLYLMGYRNHGSFHEACVQRIADDLVGLLEPRYLSVKGQFAARGGIPFWPTVMYYGEGTKGNVFDKIIYNDAQDTTQR